MISKGILENNWREVNARIERACARSGRAPEAVRLVAVTKTVGVEEMRALVELGAKELGENRVQETIPKFAALGSLAGVRKHMIGHLQRNKVRQAFQHFDYFHSLDSLRLAEEMEKEAAKQGETVPVLLQVNIAGEEQKHGVAPPEVSTLLVEASKFTHLRIEGMMTMAPLVDDPENARPVFRQLRELRDALAVDWPGLKELSMGMTQDFEVAVEEGATFVRIGSALFRHEE